MSEGLSPRLTAFLRAQVGSLELLEVLLFLHRYPEAAFDAGAIAAELRLQPRSVATRCAALRDAGLVIVDGAGKSRFNDAFADASVVSELATAWASHRARVIETVFSKPADNIRIFADAFVFGANKRGKKDG